MKKLQVWFDKGFFTNEWIGVAEYDGERTLISESDTILDIQNNIAEILPACTHGYSKVTEKCPYCTADA